MGQGDEGRWREFPHGRLASVQTWRPVRGNIRGQRGVSAPGTGHRRRKGDAAGREEQEKAAARRRPDACAGKLSRYGRRSDAGTSVASSFSGGS